MNADPSGANTNEVGRSSPSTIVRIKNPGGGRSAVYAAAGAGIMSAQKRASEEKSDNDVLIGLI
jgi:hypothetical protein